MSIIFISTQEDIDVMPAVIGVVAELMKIEEQEQLATPHCTGDKLIRITAEGLTHERVREEERQCVIGGAIVVEIKARISR